LNFTKDEEFLFYFVLFSISYIFCFFCLSFLDRKRNMDKKNTFKEQIEASRNNYIWVNLDTLEMISNYYNKEDEKK
jgi:hypothetical protein